MAHIRIESHQNVVTNAKVIFVDGDTEVDISRCVQAAHPHLELGEIPTVTIRAYLGSVDLTTPRTARLEAA